ncbi:MAG TPA: isoprenylcysteine carboxylmethyltransferase family protein [Vicinamibacterales bacterium]|jgi:methyltransferase
MALSVRLYLVLLAAVATGRFVELAISRRHQQRLAGHGVRKVDEPHFRWMVALHTGVLVGAAVEVVWLDRPLIPWLAATMGVVFAGANLTRWWVIRTLGTYWNVAVMDSSRLGIVTKGPYRVVRHPNYTAVFAEMVALPLIHTAWITAAAGTMAHLWVLSRRVAVEDELLMANPAYRAAMGHKPRFIPSLRGVRRDGSD